MYLWKLTLTHNGPLVHDTLRTVVVAARTQKQARNMAMVASRDEGRAVWSDDRSTECIAIGEADPTRFSYPAVICADVLKG